MARTTQLLAVPFVAALSAASLACGDNGDGGEASNAGSAGSGASGLGGWGGGGGRPPPMPQPKEDISTRPSETARQARTPASQTQTETAARRQS